MADWQKEYIDRLREAALKDAMQRYTGEESNSSPWEGSAAQAQFNDRWDNITLEDALNFGENKQRSPLGNELLRVSDDDPAAQAFKDRFGEASFDPAEENDKPLTGLRFSYEKPNLFGREFGEWAQDPSRVMQLEDGRWVWEAGNVKGDALANIQAQEADSGVFKGDAMDILKIAAFFAGGMGLESLLAGAAEAVSGAGLTELGSTAGIDSFAATDAFGAASQAELAGAAGGASGATGGLVNTAAGLPTVEVPGLLEPVVSTPTNMMQAAPSLAGAGAATGGGNLISQGMSWFNGLSPAARQVIGMGVSAGANALLQNNAQQNMLDAQRAAEERAREDKQRRGQVQAFQPGSFNQKPLPGGLINRGGI